MIANPPEIHAENVHAIAQFGGFQNLIALQRPVRLGFDLAQLVIRVLEKEMLRAVTNAKDDAGREHEHEHDLREENKNAAVPMLRRLVRAHANIEKMLLPALARVRHTLILRMRPWVLRSHFAARRFAESWMIRAQSCG